MSTFTDHASSKSSMVVTGINALMVILLMVFLWWSIVPALDKVIEYEREAVLRDAEQTKAINRTLKKTIENQEHNRKLLEESIKAIRAAQPPEAKK